MAVDKAFDGSAERRACEAIGAEAAIPAKADRVISLSRISALAFAKAGLLGRRILGSIGPAAAMFGPGRSPDDRSRI